MNKVLKEVSGHEIPCQFTSIKLLSIRKNMKILSNLIDNLFSDDTAFFRHSWLITRIGNAEKFIEFVLLEAPEQSIWDLGDDTWLETQNILSQSDLNENKFDLTEDIRKKLIALLPDLQITDSVIAHSIQSQDGSTFFKSYDNLTCVWLSKEVSENMMTSAAKKYDFDYVDYEFESKSKYIKPLQPTAERDG